MSSIKISFNGDIRVTNVNMDDEALLTLVHSAARSMFSLSHHNLRLTYVDIDGDAVTVNSASLMREAATWQKSQGKNTPLFTLHAVSDPSAPPKIEGGASHNNSHPVAGHDEHHGSHGHQGEDRSRHERSASPGRSHSPSRHHPHENEWRRWHHKHHNPCSPHHLLKWHHLVHKWGRHAKAWADHHHGCR